MTCYGKKVEYASCPKDQYMVVKNASYRGLSTTKTCGLSDDYSCEVDATCLVKKQCDGQHECDITVDDNVFPANSCQGFTRYLYFEYQCIDSPTPYVCGMFGCLIKLNLFIYLITTILVSCSSQTNIVRAISVIDSMLQQKHT